MESRTEIHGQEIELVHDREKYDFIEGAKRGGISTVTKRYARANNPYMGKEYDPEKPTKYIMYFDENNLYGWSMSQPLPHRVTDWMSEDELNLPLEEMPPCFIEADLDYPVELHDYFSDFVPAPDNIIPEGSKVKKLTPNLFSKKNYVCHIRNLILYKNLGVKITKIRRALKFDESPWLKPYIDLNTDLRTKAKNRSDYDTYKLMNNAVFGKTCENKLNRTDYRLSSSRNEVRKLIARPTFKDVTAYNETLAGIHLDPSSVTLDKPSFVGVAVLDLSKLLMYDFFYNYLKPKYGDNVKLLMTDTDSFLLEIETKDVYNDIRKDVPDYFDTSDYPDDHPAQLPRMNKKVIGNDEG